MATADELALEAIEVCFKTLLGGGGGHSNGILPDGASASSTYSHLTLLMALLLVLLSGAGAAARLLKHAVLSPRDGEAVTRAPLHSAHRRRLWLALLQLSVSFGDGSTLKTQPLQNMSIISNESSLLASETTSPYLGI